MLSPRPFLVLGLAALTVAQLDIRQLFNVDPDTNLEGGCGYVGLTKLNQLPQDCVRLADALIDLTNDYRNPAAPFYHEARRLVNTFLKPRLGSLNADLDTIRGRLVLKTLSSGYGSARR